MIDKVGREIPGEVEPLWKEAAQFETMLTTLQRVKVYVEKAYNESDLRFRECGQDSFIDIGNAIISLKRVLPYALCPYCQGRTRQNCTACKQRGFVSKFFWDRCVPLEIKQLIERQVAASPSRGRRYRP